MRKRLFNQQSEPRSRKAQKTWRLSVKAKIMMALIVLMLIPQVTWAQIEYYRYNASSGAFEKDRVSSYTTLSGSTDVSKDVTLSSGTYVCSRNDVHPDIRPLNLCNHFRVILLQWYMYDHQKQFHMAQI